MTKEQIKNTGATFTPKGLSDFLASRIASYVVYNPLIQKVLDPACGDGELLFAMAKSLSSLSVDFSLIGYDANEQYLALADDRNLPSLGAKVDFVHTDFLQSVDITNDRSATLFDQPQASSINGFFDIVIANPPYVRTQILGSERAQGLARKFNLKGRVDLYYPFLIAMTESLKENGILGVITSNRYLSTKSGESVRKFLSENYEILELIDLGDTKLFSAAVLPAIFIGRKRKTGKRTAPSFTKVYEELNGYKGDLIATENIYDIFNSDQSGYFTTGGKRYKKSSGILKYKVSSCDPWEMLTPDECQWVEQIDRHAQNRIGDFFKVKVGIKSTADKVFISDKWDRLNGDKPEDELLRDLISQENIVRWHASDNFNLKVLYPYTSVDGGKQTVDIEKYPKAKKYFLKNEKRLKSRKYLIESGRNWYELWVPHRPDQWKCPKLVFPDISAKPRFYFDKTGKIVNGNCYWIMAAEEKDVEKLLLIQGLANSNIMVKYHDLIFNNRLYAGRRRYLSQYVERYPLPDVNSCLAKEIISVVKGLNRAKDEKKMVELQNQLEFKVAAIFGVDPIFTLD